MRWKAWWIGGVLWVGCASQAADAVRVTHWSPKGACEARGRVQGQGTSEALARREARKEAYALGADTVWLDEPITKMPAGRTRVSGAAMRCHAPVASDSATAQASPSEAVVPPQDAAPQADTEASAAGGTGEEPSGESLEQRLRALQELHAQGLITQEDYDARRKELLQEL